MADLISREAVIALINASISDLEYADENIAMQEAIKMLPTIDAESIVRCGECKWFRNRFNQHYCCQSAIDCPSLYDYCSRAERKDEVEHG